MRERDNEFKIGEGPIELAKPEWRDAILEIIRERRIGNDPAHDFLHIKRLMKLAEEFADAAGLDAESRRILEAAIMLHDVRVYDKNDPRAATETEESAREAEALLLKTNFNPKSIFEVKVAIRESSFEKGLLPNSPIGQLLYAIDKLDQTGAVAIMRYCASGGRMQPKRAFYNPLDPLGKAHRPRQVFKYTADALLHRIPKIQRRLKYPEMARVVAKQRNEFLRSFLKTFEQDIEDDKLLVNTPWMDESGTKAVIKVFEQAGRSGMLFYDAVDPFAEKRELQPERFAIDFLTHKQRQLQKSIQEGSFSKKERELLQKRHAFVQSFMTEISRELTGKEILEILPGKKQFKLVRRDYLAG